MNPLLHKVHVSAEQSFSTRTMIGPAVYSQWHYHREIEIVLIIQGSGTRFIGDSVENFNSGNLFVIGANMPHMFKSDSKYYEDIPELITESVVIHFLPEILHSSFLALPENKILLQFMERSNFGMSVNGATLSMMTELMKSMRYAYNGDRLIKLLQILHLLAESKETGLISHKAFNSAFNKSDEGRLNRVYHYTLNNFYRQITLKEIADIIYMCPHSFCRYFKSRTKKRYSQFLLEIRVSHVCKLLIETDNNMYMICHDSGFTNLSNFNRHFKMITGKTPLEYRKKFHA